MSTPYHDIIHLPHYVSKTRTPMSMEARAAQFAPFAALTGHDAAIAETARTTSSRRELTADEEYNLSRKIAYTLSCAATPQISITYFRPDSRKSGGAYVTIQGSIKKIEKCLNLLTLTDGTKIPLDAITDISGDVFADLDD